ncbi:glycoside hydrolase family 26 protein [Streptomyces smaragdinus]|uniref:glycoside hydrolase family 26 protein n=1 Tax=Streptomyces smaragdinus TaxID=2585196 RepID=UPI0018865E4F|nr:glycosyl hydrolase [Streptomyces smaragdinus]
MDRLWRAGRMWRTDHIGRGGVFERAGFLGRPGPGLSVAGALIVVLVLVLFACSGGEPSADPADEAGGPGASEELPPVGPPHKKDVVDPDGVYFGVAPFHAPARATTEAVYRAAKVRPRIIEYYQRWDKPFSPADAQLAYDQGALPLLTWEPWGGAAGRAKDQPRYALKKIASGDFDLYIIRVAEQMKRFGRPVVLRFAHEMNGDWYPWSERNSGNARGDYVKAYRHVHDLFRTTGATEVIWAWSPNILRGAPGVDLRSLYPGDEYVDWIGLDGYGFGHKTATEVLQPTTDELRSFTRKPILLTETGSSPGPQQPGWTADLFRWIERTPNVIGFVWFQHSKDEGGQYDYRFDIDPATKSAFRKGLASLDLTPWPVTDVKPR